ncbi:hydroxymethylpyrimidine/phosphomethylpyrimidine kinase [Paenalcaligenes niemegkensis]|uniref:bifunctional hydroxymethylpyrimidine kinase/phosphomethylpyrimidine kinase n=1 Tax=Paenalcaligenes niemegkensis TaxID=2895469 RepID=UPI001EE993CE|nr:bifunctional hydroxymethylpyrimidine kinase/phosphomethylpyrimidine kinase [Paenalcaligenes niemegkensis]MCQ9615471.1 hydroxymethylpyrimidine/phosphomethylpyrimidine kinase [Paenalcaligenes niemegkensis]
MLSSTPPMVLIFGPLDPTGASHMLADAVSCARLGTHALGVTTAIHTQDTTAVEHINLVSPEHMHDQTRCLLEDMHVSAIKAGPLYTAESASVLAQVAADYITVPLVLQLQSLPDDELISAEIDPEDVIDALCQLVLPQSDLVVVDRTLLERWKAETYLDEDLDVYQSILNFGANWVLSAELAADGQPAQYVLLGQDGSRQQWPASTLPHRLHDTKATLSCAVAALMARQLSLPEAIEQAIVFTEQSAQRNFQAGMGLRILNQSKS